MSSERDLDAGHALPHQRPAERVSRLDAPLGASERASRSRAILRALAAIVRPHRPTSIVVTDFDGEELERIEVSRMNPTLWKRLAWHFFGRPY